MNAAPTIGALLFDNSSPYSTDTIQVQVVDAVDPDSDPLSFHYDWRVNGQLVQSTTSSAPTATLDLSQPGFGDRGDLIEVFVTVSDGADSSSAAASVTVAASPSELYADYLAAVDAANAAYDISINAAMTAYESAVVAAKATAEADAAAAYSEYLVAVSVAYESYLTIGESAYQQYLNTATAARVVQEGAWLQADSAYQSALNDAVSIYFSAVNSAYDTWSAARETADSDYDGAVLPFQQAYDQAFANWLADPDNPDLQAALQQAEDDLNTAMASASATRDAAYAAADAAYQNASEAALQAYTSAVSAAESTLQTAIANANQAFAEAEGTAWANLLAALSASEGPFLDAETTHWTEYLARLTEIQNQVALALANARSELQAASSTVLKRGQASEQTAWDVYVNALGPEPPQARAQAPSTEMPPPENHIVNPDQRVQVAMVGVQFHLIAPAAFLGNTTPRAGIVPVDFQQPTGQRRPRGVIAIQPGSGPGVMGTEITVTVQRGFDANARLTVDFNGGEVDILQNGMVVQPENLRTDGNGRATFTIRLRRNYPRFGRINPVTLEPEGYIIRVISGTGRNTVFAYAHYIVTQ